MPAELFEYRGYFYSFDGWYSEKEGGRKYTSEDIISDNLTAYAHWVKKEFAQLKVDTEFTVSKDNLDGTFYEFIPSEDGLYKITSSHRSDSDVNPYVYLYYGVGDNGDFDYRYDEYNKGDNDFYLSQELEAGQSYYFTFGSLNIQDDYTILLEKVDAVDITFDLNRPSEEEYYDGDASKTIKTIKIEKGQSIYNYWISGLTYNSTYYNFYGWSSDQSANSLDYDLIADESKTVYAVWTKMKVITFDANGGYFDHPGNTTNVEGYYPENNFYSYSTPSNDNGMQLVGWATTADAEKPDIEENITRIADLGDIIYAVWGQPVKVTYNSEDGRFYGFEENELTYTSAAGKKFEPYHYSVEPNDADKIFAGWYTEAGKKITENYVLVEDITVYAKYIKYIDNNLRVTAGANDYNSESFNIKKGDSATLNVNVEAEDLSDITYNWYDSNTGRRIGDSSSSQITVSPETRTDYYCEVRDQYGNSENAYFYVFIDNAFSAHPKYAEEVSEEGYISINTEPGTAAKFEVVTEATDPSKITYQWKNNNWENIEGEKSAALTIEKLNINTTYICRVEDGYGNSTEVYFNVYINNDFRIESASEYLKKIRKGQSDELQITVTGKELEGVTYEWYRNDIWNSEPVEGANSNIFNTGIITEPAWFRVNVTDQYGNSISHEFYRSIDNQIRIEAITAKYKAIDHGTKDTLKVKVTADDVTDMHYQWYKWNNAEDEYGDWDVLEGANDLEVETDAIDISMKYRFTATDRYGNTEEMIFSRFESTISQIKLSNSYKDSEVADIVEIEPDTQVYVSVIINDEETIDDTFADRIDYGCLYLKDEAGKEIDVYLRIGENKIISGSEYFRDGLRNGIYKVSRLILYAKQGFSKYDLEIDDFSDIKVNDIKLSGSNEDFIAPIVSKVSFDNTNPTAGEKVHITMEASDNAGGSGIDYAYIYT